MVRKIVHHIGSSAMPVLFLSMSSLRSDAYSDIPMGPFSVIKVGKKSNLGISSGKKNGKNNEYWTANLLRC